MVTSSPAPRQRSARGEGDRLRIDLLDAAAELMAAHGTLESISLRAVARAAGVSPTAVYRHFDDHVTLLRASVEQCWHNFHEAMREARDSSEDPFVAFANAGEAYVRFALDRPGQYRVLFSNTIDLDLADRPSGSGGEDLGSPDRLDHRRPPDGEQVRIGAEAASPGMAAFQILVDLVTAMLRERGDDRDPFFVAVQVHSWIHGIVDLFGSHPDDPWPPIGELLDGLRDALRLTPPAAR